jgi:hypothetical protein
LTDPDWPGEQFGFVWQNTVSSFSGLLTHKAFCISHLRQFWKTSKLGSFGKNPFFALSCSSVVFGPNAAKA